jgi:hypothetical protein
MALNFPNPSRNFDETRNRVQFWGYDNAIEVSFFIETGALQKLNPELLNAEAGFLKAFDVAREKIYEAAREAYRRGAKRTFTFNLAAADV